MPITLRSGLVGNAIQTQAFPVGLDPTKKNFDDQNGNPCFLSGDNAGVLLTLSASDLEQYLADRSSRGINAIIFTVVDPAIVDANGNSPFSGTAFTNFNEPYWINVDHVIQRCLAYGITALFNPWFVGLDDSAGYHSVLYNSSTAVIQAWAAFLGNRYKNFKNIIYLLGGDADPNNAASYAALNTFAVALKAADPGHLITFEASRVLEAGGNAPNGGYSSVDACNVAYSGVVPSWLDINSGYQTATTAGSGAQRCYGQGLPCLFVEGYYAGEHSMTPLTLRQQNYSGILGGFTLGLICGNSLVYPFATGWQGQLGSTGYVQQQLLQKLLRSRRHQLLVPDIAGSVMTVGSANGAFCARTNDGQSIIAYLPSSQTITIDMSKIVDAGSLANCNWFNPQTGVVTNIGTFANSSTKNFTTPDANDWVVVADSNAAGFGAPGT